MNRRGILKRALQLCASVCVITLACARAQAGIDPRGENFRIVGGYLAEDGQHVLFNAYENAQAARSGFPGLNLVGMVVDLRTRECHPIDGRVIVVPPSRRVEARDGARSPRYAGFSAQVQDESAPAFAIDSSGRKSDAPFVEAPPFDGSPSAAELGIDSKYRVVVPLGLGYGVIARSDLDPLIACFDPFRRRVFEAATIYPGQPLAVSKTWIRPGSWLVRRTGSSPYELFDPDSRASSALPKWSADDEIALALPDGRFVITSAGGVAIYSPDTGAREAIALRGDAKLTVRKISGTEHFMRCDPTKPMLIHVTGDEWTGIARLDLARKSIVPALGSKGPVILLATLDGDELLALEDHRRLVRLEVGSSKRDVVVPAP
jgi:hypothetical protein